MSSSVIRHPFSEITMVIFVTLYPLFVQFVTNSNIVKTHFDAKNVKSFINVANIYMMAAKVWTQDVMGAICWDIKKHYTYESWAITGSNNKVCEGVFCRFKPCSMCAVCFKQIQIS